MRTLTFVLCMVAGPAAVVAQAAPVHLEPVTRIGCAECSGPEMFTRVMGLAVWNGRIHVLDGAAPMVRVFDATGSPIRAFGGEGDGPGELRMPVLIFPDTDGSVEIYDMQQRRLSRFDADGKPAGTRMLAADFFVLISSAPGSDVTYYASLRPRQTEQPIMRLTRGSDTPEEFTVLRPNIPAPAAGEETVSPILAARPGGGLAVGYGRTAYQIRIFDDQGRLVRDIVRNVPRQRKTADEIARERSGRESMNARMSAMIAESGRDPPRLSVSVDEEHRHYNAFSYDANGRLWVRTPRGTPDRTIFDLFDPEGEYLGEIRFGERVAGFAAGDDLFAGVVRDADGIQHIQVWRVR